VNFAEPQLCLKELDDLADDFIEIHRGLLLSTLRPKLRKVAMIDEALLTRSMMICRFSRSIRNDPPGIQGLRQLRQKGEWH
jgi:hypothetical protein